MEVYWLMMVIQVMSSSHVVHVGNFALRSECEVAAKDVTRPAAIGMPTDAAAFYCVRAFDQRVLTPPVPK